MAKKDDRTRNWTIVVYPESAPKNWREIIDNLHIPWLISPLHDKDVNPDGTKKKPHWHIVLVFENKKAFHQIKEIADSINSPIPQKVASLRGMVRYLIHLDNPEKYQYPRTEIVNHGVDDLEKYFETASTQRQILREICDYIQENHVIHLTDLVAYAMDKDDWFDVITNRNTMFLTSLIKSEWRKQNYLHPVNNMGVRESYESSSIDSLSLEDKIKFLREHGYSENKNLVKYLSDQGYSQKELAEGLGVSRKTIYRWLNQK